MRASTGHHEPEIVDLVQGYVTHSVGERRNMNANTSTVKFINHCAFKTRSVKNESDSAFFDSACSSGIFNSIKVWETLETLDTPIEIEIAVKESGDRVEVE